MLLATIMTSIMKALPEGAILNILTGSIWLFAEVPDNLEAAISQEALMGAIDEALTSTLLVRVCHCGLAQQARVVVQVETASEPYQLLRSPGATSTEQEVHLSLWCSCSAILRTEPRHC